MPSTSSDRPSVPAPVDLLVAVALVVFLLVVSPLIPPDRPDQRPVDTLGGALIVVAAGSLVARRVAPRVTLAVSTAAVAVYAVIDFVGGPVYLAPLVALFTLARAEGRRAAAVPGVIAAVALLSASMVRNASYDSVRIHLLWLSWAVASVLIGDTVRQRAEQVQALRERARVLEETREEEARRRVAEERLRIARDVHDVVAHSLASISVQAGMGAHVIDRHPDEARAALEAIARASREALDDLRATLAVLRDGGRGTADRAPTAGLADIDPLVETAERAGVAVTVDVDGLADRRLPPAVDATAYRIVQESLTNVMRHAGADRAQVRVTVGDGTLEIEVVDDGRGPAAAPAPGDDGDGDGDDAREHAGTGARTGHGITGMGERAALVGGHVTAGPRPDGRGFRVHAVLPLPRHDAPHDARQDARPDPRPVDAAGPGAPAP